MKNVNFKYACLNNFKSNIVKPQYNKIVKNVKTIVKITIPQNKLWVS